MRTNLDQWVSQNNPPEEKQFSKGWWDFIEFVRQLADTQKTKARVISTLQIQTPPPTETLEMPIIEIRTASLQFVLKNDFGQWPQEYVCSIKTAKPFSNIYGLFEPTAVLDKRLLPGVPKHVLWGTHKQNPQQFSCALTDRDSVYTLFWLLTHQPKEKGCNPRESH